MRLLYILLLAISLHATFAGGEETTPTPNRIKNEGNFVAEGYNVMLTEAPWHAGIYRKTSNPYMQICGGTVVAKNAVISAAHCFSRDGAAPLASEFAVAAGKIYRPWNNPRDEKAQKSDVKDIMIPARYQGSVANFQDDIAIVMIVTEFVYNAYVQPACISFDVDFDEAQLQDGQLGEAVGWGLLGKNDVASKILQGAMLPIVGIKKCVQDSPASFKSFITGDKICAGYKNGTALCRGDSGGGLTFKAVVMNTHNNRAFLRGVVSTAPATQDLCNVYTWITFTHLLKHEHFIKSYLPDIELSCVNTADPQIVFTFGQTEIVPNLGVKTCTCECRNR